VNTRSKQFKLLIRRIVPIWAIEFLRVFPYYFAELFQSSATAQGDIAVPPVWKMFDGPRNKRLFLESSEEALRVYKNVGGLHPDSHMLDIGCGLGRKTLALPGFLSRKARYIGVDIVRDGIDWCNHHIAMRHTNFIFLLLNVYNARYNKGATIRASDYQFPFIDKSFDLVTAWSVFTHMRPADVRNYLSETSRMLAPGGRCVFSFYIMTDKALSAVRSKVAREKIEHEFAESCFTDNKNVPEDLTAFGEDWIRAAFEASALRIEEILYGSWVGDGRSRNFPLLNYQDIVVASRA
jgi:cyclopropane fatty-acyl-phospholipid synthase-like methyltransferase